MVKFNGAQIEPGMKVNFNGERIKKIRFNGTVVYQSSITVTRSVSVTQAAQPDSSTNSDSFAVPEGFTKLVLKSFDPGKSFGETKASVSVVRNGENIDILRFVKVEYTGSGYKTTQELPPHDVFDGLRPGDAVKIIIVSNYNPQVQTSPYQSTATATYVFE